MNFCIQLRMLRGDIIELLSGDAANLAAIGGFERIHSILHRKVLFIRPDAPVRDAICPGFFPSKMASGLLETIGADVIAHTPLGRLGGDTDLQGAAVYLASEASRHVTGQYIAIDGGASATQKSPLPPRAFAV